jgi:hypothetical protein
MKYQPPSHIVKNVWRSGFFKVPTGEEYSERLLQPCQKTKHSPLCCDAAQHSQLQGDDFTISQVSVRVVAPPFAKRQIFSQACVLQAARSPMFLQVSLFNFQRTLREKNNPLIYIRE